MMARFSTSVFLTLSLAATPGLAQSPTMSTSPLSSGLVCGAPGLDVCVPGADLYANFPPALPLVTPGTAALGLLPGDVVMSLSFGLEPLQGGGNPEPILFSVDPLAVGVVGTPPDVASEAALADAPGDIYSAGTFGSPIPNKLLADGDGQPLTSPPATGLVEPWGAPGDDITALASCDVASPFIQGIQTFFTLAPGSPTLVLFPGVGAEDIFSTNWGTGAPPLPTFPGATLGLGPGDVIDAMVIDLNMTGVGNIVFTLTPGSPYLGFFPAGPGDLFIGNVFGGGPAVPFMPAPTFGLAIGDDIDALDIPFDVDGDTVNSACDNCQFVANNDQLDTDGDFQGDLCDPCPADPLNLNSGDTDLDGAADCVDICTTVASSDPNAPTTPPDQNPSKSTILIKNLHKGAGEQGVVVKGFFNPADPNGIDPETNGVHFVLQDGSGILYDINIPGGTRTKPPTPNGLCDASGKDGWQTIAAAGGKTIWKYFNVSGALPPCVGGEARGIFRIILKDLTSTGKAAYQYIVKSKKDTLPHTPAFPVTTMQADLTLAQQPTPGTASQAAMSGQCAESIFRTPLTGPPKPFCKEAPASGPRKKIICKGL
jgi:hypothetical protein